MPQLSLETFVTQYFWLLIVFFSVFILCSLFFIPKIAQIKKTRKLLESVDVSFNSSFSQLSVSLFKQHKC